MLHNFRRSNENNSGSYIKVAFTSEICGVTIDRHYLSISVFHKLFSTAAHPNLSKTWRHTTKFHLIIRGYEILQAITMYLHMNPCHVRMQAHDNKIQHMLNKLSIMNLCVCITKDKILSFSNYNVRIYNSYKNSRHTGCRPLIYINVGW
jgi:hypothetical protein